MAKFLEGMRALARKDVVQNAARYLEVDIKAAGISTGPAATPMTPARKAERAPAPSRPAPSRPVPSRPAAPARSAPSRKAPTPKRAAPHKKAAAPRTTGGAARPAAALRTTGGAARPAAAPRTTGGAARPAAAPARARAASAGALAAAAGRGAEQARPVSPENPPSGIPGDEIAEALLAHVEIEPGQGIDDLALAMGTPAAELQEPIKRLLEENKITEELSQGQTSYYPT
ncbi:hypothetical protein WMF28_18275 [Sorangium sp. So ce590]|uniref:hypothetical protein n=1 Tax=Sorangium sp. So ce590 TaxID=3133317 RepID=UPI003F621A90